MCTLMEVGIFNIKTRTREKVVDWRQIRTVKVNIRHLYTYKMNIPILWGYNQLAVIKR